MGAKTRMRMRPSKRKYSKYPRKSALETRLDRDVPRADARAVCNRNRAIAISLAKARNKETKASRGHRRAA